VTLKPGLVLHRGAQRDGKASWKAIPVERHVKAVMECVTKTASHVASTKGVTQSDTCGASRNCRHGMRNGKHQRSQNVTLSECHGKVVMDSVMESKTCATSRKMCHGKHDPSSVTLNSDQVNYTKWALMY